MCARQHRNSIGKCAVSYKCVVKVASAARAESIRLIRHCSKNENSKGTQSVRRHTGDGGCNRNLGRDRLCIIESCNVLNRGMSASGT